MKPLCAFFLIVAGCCLIQAEPLFAQATVAPFALDKQYSADMVITTKEGQSITQKIYSDDGKMRTEMNTSGMQIISIVRPDQKKVYSVMPAQKMVMEMAYDAEKMKRMTPTAAAQDGKFEVVGPDTVDGVACTKYKITSKEGKVSFMWVDASKKVPVKMAAEDGSYSLQWKNYVAGAQDAALFEPPADYQKMTMPAMPSGAGGGQ